MRRWNLPQVNTKIMCAVLTAAMVMTGFTACGGASAASAASTEASEEKADLFVVSEELVDSMGNLPVIGLEDLMDADVAAQKLKKIIEKTGQDVWQSDI